MTALKQMVMPVTGMTCSNCASAVERNVRALPGVQEAHVDFVGEKLKVVFDSTQLHERAIIECVRRSGYDVAIGKTELPLGAEKQWIKKMILSALALTGIVLVIVLARTWGHALRMPAVDSRTGYTMVLMFGFMTGLHCVGMCGSFIVGYTALDAEQGRSPYRSHLLYGVGKLISYALLGALFGLVGSFFRITPLLSGISISLAGAFLILFGLGMLDLFSFKTIHLRQPASPATTGGKSREVSRGPFFLGLFSGLLIGCGPLQVMYVAAAGVGNAIGGAVMLAFFAAGTLPALLGFGLLTRMLSGAMTRRFLHASGLILMVLGMMMLNRGLARVFA